MDRSWNLRWNKGKVTRLPLPLIENIISAYPGWKTSFYRSASGAEIDLILERGRRRIAVEVKASTSPEVKRSYWNALDDLNVDEAWIVAPVREAHPYKRGVSVRPLDAIAIPEGAQPCRCSHGSSCLYS